MKKIRIGNDFVFNWAIERGGMPEDLSSVLEKHLHLSVFDKGVELIEGVDYDITGNVIRIEVTPAIANIIGTYKAEFHYILPDNGLIDEDRKCAVDVDAFQIVARTAQADDPSEFTVTSDMAIAFKGDKGDSAYQVWLDAGNIGTEEDYFAYLKQPAVDAGASISELESEIQVNEGLRVSAESERDLAEGTRIQSESERLSAETIRQSNEGDRIDNEATRIQNEAERISEEGIRQSNETDRVEAESERVQAESERAQAEVERQATIQEAVTATNLANEKANLANTAAQNANEAADSALTATQEATTAASLADTARLAIQTDLAQKADHGYESIPKTLKQVDDKVLEVDSNLAQLEGEVSVKIENLIVDGSFEDGIYSHIYGTIVNDVYRVGSKSILFSADGTAPYFSHNIICNATDKLYITASYRLKSVTSYPSVFMLRISDYASFTNSITIQNLNQGQQVGVWYDYSSIINGRSGGVRFTGGAFNSGVIDFYFDNIKCINLTATFGAGNEPTKEEFELLLSIMGSQYFEGEITIPAQKVMQWQLAMIRQNRNAIIALGGTII